MFSRLLSLLRTNRFLLALTVLSALAGAYVGLGIVLPLVVQSLAVGHRIRDLRRTRQLSLETVAADVEAKPASKQVSLAGVLAGKPRQFLDGRSHREGRPGASLPPADTDLTKSSTNLHAASGSPGEKCGRFTTKGRISWLKLDDGS